METKTVKNQQKLTVKDVAKIYGVSMYTVRKWARENKIPAQKIGKKWYFNPRLIFNDHSMKKALQVLGANAIYSSKQDYDIELVENSVRVRVEVKSASMQNDSEGKEFWRFSNLHDSNKSDYYLLLGYNRGRTDLVVLYLIPSKELEKYYRYKCITKNKDRGMESHCISIYRNDYFMAGFAISENYKEKTNNA